MLALVTGASGFLGLYIVELLRARGNAVRGLCRGGYPELDRLGVETVQADLRDREAVVGACQGVDVVFHVAALAGLWGPWKEFHGINTVGTQNVIDGCLRHGVPRLVYTSSPSVTFDGRDQCHIDESAPYPQRWYAHYPHSKALAEQAVLCANGQSGLATSALRPHLIWGPRDRHLVPRLVARARAGKLRRVGDGQNLVDTVYVENAAAAHVQLADRLAIGSRVAGRAYFISQGEPVNCWEWVNRLLAVYSLPHVTQSISAGAAWRIGALLEFVHGVLRIQREPRMTRFLAAQLSRSHYFNIQRAREDFLYEPRISTEEGLRRLALEARQS